MLTGSLMREARLLAGLSLGDLAADLRIVGTPSLGRIEMYDEAPPISDEYAAAIQRALEAAGVEFIPENGGGAGVRLRKMTSTGRS